MPQSMGLQSQTRLSDWKRLRFDPGVGKILWRRAWQLTPVFLPGKSHGQRSLVGEQRSLQSMESQRVEHDYNDLTHEGKQRARCLSPRWRDG